ncbi:MAG: PE-PGRS family protein [Parcubacteria group bacterium GW2011_GWA2_47_10b]|nr:MAG: PE-PGRS family protein [Parcubacteria group bacterium GW2011_GWA2_47_10b]
MKKILLIVSILFLPLISYAAYDDVSLSTGSEITVSGGTLTGDNGATLESLDVGADNFTVVMPAGSSFNFASANKKTITVTGGLGSVAVTSNCGASSATYAFSNPSSGTTLSLIVEVGSATCTGGLSAKSGSGVVFGVGGGGGGGIVPSSGGGGGGGGGGSYTPAPVVVVPTPTPTYANGLSAVQVSSILSLLQSFGADQSIIDNVRASLMGSVASGGSSASAGIGTATGYVFAKALKTGSANTDVKKLQLILNSDPDTQIASSGVGSSGNETNYYGSLTRKAVEKFQVKYGIAKSGDEGYGTVGPKTRAKLNDLAK